MISPTSPAKTSRHASPLPPTGSVNSSPCRPHEVTLRRESIAQTGAAACRSLPGSIHVREVGLKAADDPVVWEYAKNNGLMIVSKDSDMHQRSFVFGYPPKVVWVRLGNCSTSDVEKLLRKHFAAIKAFYEDDYASFLSLS